MQRAAKRQLYTRVMGIQAAVTCYDTGTSSASEVRAAATAAAVGVGERHVGEMDLGSARAARPFQGWIPVCRRHMPPRLADQHIALA